MRTTPGYNLGHETATKCLEVLDWFLYLWSIFLDFCIALRQNINAVVQLFLLCLYISFNSLLDSLYAYTHNV